MVVEKNGMNSSNKPEGDNNMLLADFAVTLEGLKAAVDLFVSEKCEKSDDHLVHKDCGGAIRIGFLNLFYQNDDGSLDPGWDGFGIGPRRVPYCEKCFPPDGFNHRFAVRFPILRNAGKRVRPKLTWGSSRLLDA